MLGTQGSGVILAVDDEPVSLKLLLAFLERHGYTVVVATGGEDALARVKEAQPDLILLDIMMPVLDGYETCRAIKAQAETAEIPVIFVTALTNLSDKVKGFEVGGVDYVTKPFQHEEVLARINTHINLANLRKELESKNRQIKAALDEIRKLSVVLPFCAKCKKIRDDEAYWQQVKKFMETHTGAAFTHSYCPDCHATELGSLGDL